jgi:hypothetical protein
LLKLETAGSSETLVLINQITRRHIEGHNHKPKMIIHKLNLKNNDYVPELRSRTGCSGEYLGQRRMQEHEAGESYIMNYIITVPYKAHTFSD